MIRTIRQPAAVLALISLLANVPASSVIASDYSKAKQRYEELLTKAHLETQSLNTVWALSKDIKNDLLSSQGMNGYLTVRGGVNGDQMDYIQRYDQELQKFQVQTAKIWMDHESAHWKSTATKHVINSAIVVGSAVGTVATGGVGAAGIGVLAYSATELNGHLVGKYQQQADEHRERAIDAALSRVNTAAYNEMDRHIRAGQPAAAVDILIANNTLLQAAINDEPDQTQRELLRTQFAKGTEERVLKGLKVVALSQEEMREDLNQLKAFNTTFTEFTKETKSRLNNLENAQKELATDLNELRLDLDQTKGQTKKNTSDIKFMQDMMFGQMNPKDQLKALEAGWKSDLPASERKSLERQINIAKKTMEFQHGMNTALAVTDTLMTLAAAAGVSPKFIKGVSKVANAAKHAVNAVTSYLTGNPIGAITSVGSLIGGLFGGPDVGALRHQQIMEKFEEVLAGQQEIKEALKIIDAKVDALLEGQRIMFETLAELRMDIERYHLENMNAIEDLRQDVLYNRRILVSVLSRNIDRCDEFLASRNRFPFNNFSGFESFSNLASHFAYNHDKFDDCAEGLSQFFRINTDRGIPEIFFMKSYEGESLDPTQKNQITDFIKRVYKPTFTYTHAWLGPNGLEQKLLFTPQKVSAPLLQSAKRTNGDTLLENPLSVPHLFKRITTLFQVHPYFDWRDHNAGFSRLYDMDVMLKNSTPQHDGEDYLKSALQYANTALAQEGLIAGTSILSSLKDSLFVCFEESKNCATNGATPTKGSSVSSTGIISDTYTTLEEMNKGALDIVLSNPYAARNLGLYFVYDLLSKKITGAPHTTYLAYHAPWSQSSVQYMKQFIGDTLRVRKFSDSEITDEDRTNGVFEGGWYLVGLRKIPKTNDPNQFDDKNFYLRMPTPAELRDEFYTLSSNVNVLLPLRDGILKELVTYKLTQKSLWKDEEERTAFIRHFIDKL